MDWHPAELAYERGKRVAARRYLETCGISTAWGYADDARNRRDRVRRAYWLGVLRAMRSIA